MSYDIGIEPETARHRYLSEFNITLEEVSRQQPYILEKIDIVKAVEDNQEKKVVGVEGVYHRNSICTWEVRQDGSVHNVQVRTDNCPK